MKCFVLSVLLGLFFASKAQDSIPNAGFENWTPGGLYWQPDAWQTLNPITDVLGLYTVFKDTMVVHSGHYSTRMTTVYSSAGNQNFEGMLTTGMVDLSTQVIGHGIPIHSRPPSFNGWYQYVPVGIDTALISITLFKLDSAIGSGSLSIVTRGINWTSFSVPVSYNSGDIPDSVQLIFESGTNAGSSFWVDDLSYIPRLNLGSDQTICINSSVILNPVISGLVPPLSYFWQATGNQLSCTNCAWPSVTITQNSSFILSVTDANNLTLNDTINYTINGTTGNLQMTLTNSGITCANRIDTATAIVTNGTAPFTVDWGNGTVHANVSSIVNSYTDCGIYVVSVTDASGCLITAFDTVVNASVHVSIDSVVNPNCGNLSTGSIGINVTGGQPPYSYSWSTGATTGTVASAAAGDYTVIVNDVNLCSAAVTYTLNPLSQFYVFINEGDANCSSNGSLTATAYNGTAPYSYQWSNGNTSSAVSGLSAGPYSVTVTDLSGCQVSAQGVVYSSCASYITGFVFNDLNNNCIQDSGEMALPGVIVVGNSTTGQWIYGATDQNGNYSMEVDYTGNYTLGIDNEFNNTSCANSHLCPGNNGNVHVTQIGDTIANVNLSVTYSNGFDLTLHPGWTPANPGFQKEYWIMPFNASATPFSAPFVVTFAYDSNLVYQYSYYPIPVNDPLNHTLTWNLDTLVPSPYFDWDNFRFETFFTVPVSLSLNYQLQSRFTINPTIGDCDSSNNSFIFSEVVTGSHDPNEKEVKPANNISPDDSVLTYTIHFQNNGTDSTHFIIVRDTLSASLNPSTVRTIASSYKYSSFTITGNNILTWTFNPYRLPDSTTNPVTSKGFVEFTVNKKRTAPLNSVISNVASIYFDYNSLVVTNTVRDTVAYPANVINVMNNVSDVTVKAFPNPFNDATNIVVVGLSQPYTFQLYDLTGRLLRTLPSVNTNQFRLNRESLAAGVYTYRIVMSAPSSVGLHQIAFGKIVVQ